MKTYVGRLLFENGVFYTSSKDLETTVRRVYAEFPRLDTVFGVAIVQITELDVMNNADRVVEEYLFEYRDSRWMVVDRVV